MVFARNALKMSGPHDEQKKHGEHRSVVSGQPHWDTIQKADDGRGRVRPGRAATAAKQVAP